MTKKKYYVNGTIEWLYTRCNHHVKTKEKAAKWGFSIKYSHVRNGIINESRISQLNELIKQQRIYNKPNCGNSSYYVYEQVDNLVPTEKPPPLALSKTPPKPLTLSLESPKAPSKISSAIPLETALAEPLKSPKNPNTPRLFSETNFCRELNLMKDHIKALEAENEAIKLFIKEQLYVIKKINQWY